MWEQVALRFNASLSRFSAERDIESLRRTFTSLYTKPKSTGSGEASRRYTPVIWAKPIQTEIEAEGGKITSHDSFD
ncbi:hypothetical protein PR003_g12901 [Phytophthora rubi]|uniref:DUF6818 domain-containing protein n=1 Tax=Phytophthora rubi TaxID=129364 RepID=A0A6A4F7Y1_9STRA|nr:hypothetical protein PR002_g12875 [Phytophthora rubi]KAE9335662.1 hypothetical protein PR003_g12901 [Phytophthora rubi]